MPPLSEPVKQYWINELMKQEAPGPDGFYHCPRCDHPSKRRNNLKNQHLAKDNPCEVINHEKDEQLTEQVGNTSNVEIHGDNNTVNVNQVTLTAPTVNINLMPFRAPSMAAWEHLFKQSWVTIRKRLGADFEDVDSLMLATLKMMHLNSNIPENMNVKIEGDELKIFDSSLRNRTARWRTYDDTHTEEALKNVLATMKIYWDDVTHQWTEKMPKKKQPEFARDLGSYENQMNSPEFDEEYAARLKLHLADGLALIKHSK